MVAKIPTSAASTEAEVRARPWRDFFVRFLEIAGPYWRAERKWKARWLTLLLVLLTVAQVAVPVALNAWNQNLFDALEKRSMGRFALLLGALLLIIAANVVITTTHLRVKRRIQIDWRDWLTHRIEHEWMQAGRHYLLAHIPGKHDNPDGRIAEDIRITTEYAIDLAHSLFYCGLLLASFTQILWSLSGSPEIEIGGMHFYIPGYLVWLAVVQATIGTSVALLLGRPLVRATDRRQTFEANFRFGLMHARENALAIALVHGETDERRRFSRLFRGAEKAWDVQTGALTNIFIYISSWTVFSQAFPVLVAAPRYIAGTITLGTLMQTVQAFQQMITALSWPIDNLSKLADWRASVERVLGLHAGIANLVAHVSAVERQIAVAAAAEGRSLRFREVSIAGPGGDVVVSGLTMEIKERDHVLIAGDPSATDMIFRVVAGLWPWGQGRVELPRDAIFFMPERPYLPVGSLRDAISYPGVAESPSDEQIRSALRQVGLEPLVSRLDDIDTWEVALPIGDQQRLGFARLILHRASWIFLQSAIDALDAKGQTEMMTILKQDFADATVITIGHRAALDGYYRRKLLLKRSAGTVALEELPPE